MSSDNRLPLPDGWASAWPTVGLKPSEAPHATVEALDFGWTDAAGAGAVLVALPADLVEGVVEEMCRVASLILDGSAGADDAESLRQTAEALALPPSIIAMMESEGDHDEEG